MSGQPVKRQKKEPGKAVTSDGLQQFKKAVQELKNKSQAKIQNLTAMADAHKEAAEEVSQIIAEEIQGARVERLQPLFSVVDSILKKVTHCRAYMAPKMPGIMQSALSKSDDSLQVWLRRMSSESWRKHELLPAQSLDLIDRVFAARPTLAAAPAAAPAASMPPGAQAAPVTGQSVATIGAGMMAVKLEQQQQAAKAQAAKASLPDLAKPPPPADPRQAAAAASGAAAASATSVGGQPGAVPGATGSAAAASSRPPAPPPMKGPPPKRVVTKVELGAEGPGAKHPPPSGGKSDEQKWELWLQILTRIINKKPLQPTDLSEITKVPEVKKAIKMQQNGQVTEAQAILNQFQRELQSKVARREAAAQSDPRRADPRQPESRPADPRQQDARPADPRQAAARSSDPRDPRAQAEPRPSEPKDPRQADKRVDSASASKRTAAAQIQDPRQKQPKVAATGSEAEKIMKVKGQEAALDAGPEGLAVARQILQGLPSLGFSESWLRQFMEQMPARSEQQEARKLQAPAVGRKVLSAEGDQMVYVDELSPSEVLLLMQFVFLLEERLRQSGGGIDFTQRVPHTFSYLQVEPAIDVMLKRFFDELPYQCTTTGLRFASREKLRKHHDVLYRRRATAQQRQRGAEARGWMETIPEWVGNRDLVVGPALFQLASGTEEGTSGSRADRGNALQRAQRSAATNALNALEEEESDDDEDPERDRWICPLDDRRSVCPISGEPFERTWSSSLNTWAFSDVVAVEVGTTDKVLRFPPSRHSEGSDRLSETAVVFKKSCFLNTAPPKRLEALEECSAIHAFTARDSKVAQLALTGGPCEPADASKEAVLPAEDPELAAFAASLMAPRPTAKFF